jgi:DNA-binding NarL/FixJ family response regulator
VGLIHGTDYAPPQMAARPPVRVMVIDDHAGVRHLLGLILAEHPDIEVVAEADGATAALARIGAAAPDVALLDARMPVVDGFELAPLLLRRAPQLRIAVLTSQVDAAIEERALAAGAHVCLDKARLERLPELVRKLASG